MSVSPATWNSARACGPELGDWKLRRRKDVLPGLKGKQRQLLKVALSPEERKQYDVLRLEDRPVFARLSALGVPGSGEGSRGDGPVDELDAEDKVILFCEFKPTVAALKELCEQAGSAASRWWAMTRSPSGRRRSIASSRIPTAGCSSAAAAARTGNNLTAAANYVFSSACPGAGQQG